MKMTKYLLMALVMFITSVCLSSCSKDDDEPIKSSLQNYFIEIDLKGGGLDAAEASKLKAGLNQDVSEFTYAFKGLNRDEAIYKFDDFVKEFKKEFSEGMNGISETLDIIFT